MRKLAEDGSVRYIGVSNFSDELLAEAQDALGDRLIVCNQVVYNLQNRIIEKRVKPYCDQHGITVMAYSPLGDGRFPEPGTEGRAVLDRIAAKYGKTPYQVALNWLIAQGNVIAIPKASNPRHAVENAQAAGFELAGEDLAENSAGIPAAGGRFCRPEAVGGRGLKATAAGGTRRSRPYGRSSGAASPVSRRKRAFLRL